MRGNKLENHIYIFWNQKLWVENPKLMNMHNRLSIQSIFFANYRPIITSCQKFYTLGGEERRRNMEKIMSICLTWFPIGGLGEPYIYHDSGVFYKKWGSHLETVWLCEELVGVIHRIWMRVCFRGGYCSICFPLTNLTTISPFLLYPVPFHSLPFFYSPSYFLPSW